MIFHAKKYINSSLFYVELKHPPPHFLRYLSFVNIMERSSLYQITALKKIVLLPEIHNIKFSFILKFINSSFLLNMNFPLVQSSCFYNNFFLSKKIFSYHHFKRSKAILIIRQNVKLN